MFVADAARGRGTARLLLSEIEGYARDANIRLIQLETGPLQHAALALYERCGYGLIPNFGEYVGDDNSVCYEKPL
jgi:putative acetyltransferase